MLALLFACDPTAGGDYALAFDGPPDCGTVELSGAPPDSFTVELWMRGDADAGAQYRPMVTWPGLFQLAENESGSVTFAVGEGDTPASYPFTQMDGVLHHIAGTYDAADGSVSLFVDGKLQAINDAFPGEPDSRVQVGCAKEYTEAFSGLLDEIRFSSVVRYTTDFERPTTPFKADDDTVMLFHLDEGAGDTSESAVGDFVMELSDTTWLEFSLASGDKE